MNRREFLCGSAGTAAALAAKQGVSPRGVNPAALVATQAKRIRFYYWMYGDIGESDSDIGTLGEYVVGKVLECLPERRKVHSAYDLTLGDGRTLEVKTTSTPDLCGNGSRRWRWRIKDQKRMLEGREPMADFWIFLKVQFPKTRGPLFDFFDEKWWTAYAVRGADLLAHGAKVTICESVVARLAVVTGTLSDLKRIKAL